MRVVFRTILLIIILIILSTVCFAQSKSPVPHSILEEQLTIACRKTDLETVKKLLAQGISANVRDRFNQPPILLAVRNLWEKETAFQIVELLLKNGANINDKNHFGTTPLMIVQNFSKFSNNDDFFIKRGADTKVKDKFGGTVEDYPYFGTDEKFPHFADEKDKNLLNQNEVIWRFALEKNLAKVDEKTELKRLWNGVTLLMALAYYADNSNIEHLPGDQKDFAAVDKQGDSAVFYAVTGDCANCLFPIEDKNLFNLKNKSGETALIRAAQFDRDLIILKLLQKGANPNLRDNSGKTALFYSAEYDYFQTTLNLIIGGADVNMRNSEDLTPLMSAAKSGHKNAVTAFVFIQKMARQAKLTAQKSKRKSDIILAQRLAKIDLNVKNKQGETALSLAQKNNRREIVKLLKM